MNIQDNEINVEEIMRKIRENIRRKWATGYHLIQNDTNDAIQYDLSNINSNWDIHNNYYFISSHRPLIGKFLVKGRQVVNGEVRRYIDPVLFQQTEFNASTVRLLNYSLPKIEELINQLSLQRQELLTGISQHDEKFSRIISQFTDEITQRIIQQDEKINTDIQNYIDSNFHDKRILSESNTQHAINYFLFEEQFRGTRDDIKGRQMEFLHYFKNCSHVLDIGCGRGEFLEILKEQGIGGTGVDSDPDMVAYCRSRQLDVIHSDAITYLEMLDDKSLDGIFIDQVVEHLEPDYLIKLLTLCYQKMKFGYYIVVETVNPLSFVSFVNFYIDMTHKRPVHPETLQYLLTASGFRECVKSFFSPVPEESRLEYIEERSEMNAQERKDIEIYNKNITILNTMLFGPQDYAVIGKK